MSPEKFTVKTQEIPTGRGGELNKAMRENLLLFEKVKNKVILENSMLRLPFKIEEMGLFAKAAFSEEMHSLESDEHRLEAWPEHTRSALLSRVIIGDEDGSRYRDTDLKGNGFVLKGNTILEPGGPRATGGDYFGLREKEVAIDEHWLSEKFHEAGIRTARTLAIMELEEIIVRGQKISIKEAKEKWGLMDKEFTPVIEVRAFGTKARIMDIVDIVNFLVRNKKRSGFEKKKKDLLLEDAKKLVSQETGKDLMSNDNYAKWFAPALGQNLGLMHKNGWVHHGLNKHNITLDCKIVDLGSVTKSDKVNFNEISEDVSKALGSFYELVWALGVGGSQFLEYKEQLLNSYNKSFPLKER